MFRFVWLLILAACCSALSSVCLAQAAPAPLLPWSVTTVFAPDGMKCILRFSVLKGAPVLSLENRRAPNNQNATAFFTLSNLPSLLKQAKGQIKDVQIEIAPGWSARADATWTAGDDGSGGKLTFSAAPAIASVVQPLAKGTSLVVSITASDGPSSYTFDLAGSGPVMETFSECLKRATPAATSGKKPAPAGASDGGV